MSQSTFGRILIIDDNEAIHNDFKKALANDFEPSASQELHELEAALFGTPEKTETRSGISYEIDSAFQGKEGLAKVTSALEEGRPYSLAFIDVRMPPGWDGIETTAHIWKVQPDLQVVICSAYSDYTWEDICEALDTADRMLILKKPFQRIEVRQMAHTLVRKWQLNQELEKRITILESTAAERASNLELANAQLQKEIRERELVETQLLQAQKLEAIGQLSAGIAHEINTPIQYIGDNVTFIDKSFSRLVQLVEDYQEFASRQSPETPTPILSAEAHARITDKRTHQIISQIPDALRDSLDGLERVSEIVKAMKVFSRIGPKEKTAVNLRVSLESTILVARSEWSNVATVTTDIAEDLPQIHCFPNELNQSILNLIVNAAHAIADRKASEPAHQGEIRIAAKANGESVTISIADTGCGVPEGIRSRIFEPFFTTKEVGRGTGQGLAMVYASITKTHGGTIDFQSEVGEGTTFTLTIPID